jgi:tetratricopeptide (TPR) repeat protein
MAFSRSLLPESEGCLAVWVLCPLHVGDAVAYAQFVRDLLRHEYPFPWFHHIRIILRDDAAQPALSAALASTSKVEHYVPDLSDETMEKALEEEASDESLPLEDRIQAMFISAQRDFSFSRFDEALKKHEIFLRYHTAAKNTPMVALALNSIGEIHQRLARLEQAGSCFEAALEQACAGENPPLPVLFNVLLNLANLRLGQRRLAEAEVYYDAGEKLATVQRNPSAKLQSIETLGYCQYMQGKFVDAEKSWEHGAAIAGQLEQPELQKSLLARLQAHYANSNRVVELRQVESQLSFIQRAS